MANGDDDLVNERALANLSWSASIIFSLADKRARCMAFFCRNQSG